MKESKDLEAMMAQVSEKTLPRGWQRKALAEILPPIDFLHGNESVTEKLIEEDGEVTLIFSGDLENTIHIESPRRTTLARLAEQLNQTTDEVQRVAFVPRDSVLVVIARQKACFTGLHREGEVVMNNALVALTPTKGSLLPQLLFYFFKNPHKQQQIKSEYMPGGQPYLRADDLKTVQICYPEDEKAQALLVEQIESQLAEAERARKALKANQELLHQYLPVAFDQVFSHDHLKHWPRTKLDELVTIREAANQSSRPEHEQYPLVKAVDFDAAVAEVDIDLDPPEESSSEPQKIILQERQSDCLLFARIFSQETGWLSRVAMPFLQENAPEFLCCTSELLALTVKETALKDIYPRFLFWVLQSPALTTRLLDGNLFRGTARVELARLKELEIPVPPRARQWQIMAYLDSYQEHLRKLKRTQRINQEILEQEEGRILDQFFYEE